jgi:hypothetical protein
MAFFFIALIAGGAIYYIFTKARKRQSEVERREAAFLAAARGGAPLATAPVVGAGPTETNAAVDLAVVPDQSLVIRRAAVTDPIDAKNKCVLCGQSVNPQAIDESQRAIRLPFAGSDRLIPYHAKCVALRLRQADGLQEKIADIVQAFDAAHDGLPAATSEQAGERLRNSVNGARQAIAAPPDAQKGVGV